MESSDRILKDKISAFMDLEESTQVEFKSAKGGFPGSFWESYSAFANTDGGIIILGVVEKNNHFFFDGLNEGTVTKYRKTFWDCAHNRGKISVCVPRETDVVIDNIGDAYFLICHIPRADYELRPVYIGSNPFGNTYRRNHEGDYLCTDTEIRRMFADAEHDQSLFMRLGRAEKAGSGVDKILSGWEYLGMPHPKVEEISRPDYVVLSLRLKKEPTEQLTSQIADTLKTGNEITPQVDSESLDLPRDIQHSTPQVTPQVGVSTQDSGRKSDIRTGNMSIRKKRREKRILDYCKNPKTLAEIMEFLGLKDRKSLVETYVDPMIADGRLSMTAPDRPTSSSQRYVKVMKKNR